ncbi:MAG TPA: DUF6600 domain-containing protein [Terriglobia bacterium]|nr:DUF6600 domain-containing protein [Terriglobia bacterium]
MKNSGSTRWTSFVAALVFSVMLAGAPIWAQQDDPPGRVARLSYTQGTVSLQLSGAQEWNEAAPNYPLTTGDHLYTDHDGRAELDLGNIAVQLSSDTDLTVANLNDQILQLGIGQGTVHVRVYEILEGNSIEVDTPNGALSILRPGDYRVETYPDNNTTLVSAYSGSLEITGGDFHETLEGGQAIKLMGADPIQAADVSLPGRDEFDRWCDTRNQRDPSSDSARYVSRDVPGYQDLDRNGRWVDTAEYGAVWYPGDVPPDWAPYRFGRWIWIDPWGWTWVDDAPWGFTPFHYGRWAQIDSRWGWVPGRMAARPVYAPALVAFVGGRNFSIGISFGGGGGVQAWFPLGPREPYYPWYHHDDDYLRRVNASHVTNITNIRNENTINNIQYVNRNIGTTAVPANAMRDGQAVPRQIIRLTPQQAAQAQIIPHPTVAPSAIAAVGGRPTNAPPIRPPRVISAPSGERTRPDSNGPLNRPGQPPVEPRPNQANPNPTAPPVEPRSNRVNPNEIAPPAQPEPPPNIRMAPNGRGNPPVAAPPSPPPEINRTAPPVQGEPAQPGRPGQSIAPRSGPPGQQNPPNSEPPSQPRWITRTPTPPPKPPFANVQPALQQHPGRPLEPQQMDNIRRGNPAGPMRDREYAPHPTPDKPAPASGRDQKPSKPDKQQDKKQH